MSEIVPQSSIGEEKDQRLAQYVYTACYTLGQKLRRCPEPMFLLLVSGGRSVERVLPTLVDHLVDQARRGTLTREHCDKLQVFLADERAADPESSDSNTALIRRLLEEPLVKSGFFSAAQFHYPRGMTATMTPDEAHAVASAYTGELRRNACVSGDDTRSKFKAIDAAILGVGEDGHIASLFPGIWPESSNGRDFFVVPDAPKEPVLRISISANSVGRIQFPVLCAIGEEKRGARVLLENPDVDAASCPAKLANYPFVVTDLELTQADLGLE